MAGLCIGCAGGSASPRSAFFDARAVGVEAKPGNGAVISATTRQPTPSAFGRGDLAQRPD
ncbi:MAG: hypothetical protein EA378_09420 [Phycisphaerales bacterium]|nr:MAG: hypothetical protein EA378_09420 [Phycisphaerales bacterium]